MSSFVSFLPENKKFDEYFSGLYADRWEGLKKSLLMPEKQVLRKNLFIQDFEVDNLQRCDFLTHCFWRPADFILKKNQTDIYPFYAMDPASVIVALAVGAEPDEKILDMCAAPGGKSLILAEQMRSGELISNEVSESRRERLVRVMHEYIPKEQRLFIKVKGLDGNQYGLRFPDQFDRVLADVPCSGERHLLENSKEFSAWTIKRTKNLAVRQYSLLSSAWLAAKVGGTIVYSTCSISNLENDSVVEKLVKKRAPTVVRKSWIDQLSFVEKTDFGYRILPDVSGFGPMYFSILEKK